MVKINKSWLLNIIKPKVSHAKWLIFGLLVAVIALGASGKFEIVRRYLDTEILTFKAGEFEITAYSVLRAVIIVALIFWMAAIALDFFEKRIGRMKKMRGANRSLLVKIVQIAVYVVAFLVTMDVIGIDLTTLTVFSGALGIGLGFGLQKIASNFISGLILLLEKAVEQDDLVELVDGTFGFVRRASARYTLIETHDGREILVPNEDFITSRVINWTFTNQRARIEIPVGVSYYSDIEKARALILEAAKEHPLCLEKPSALCFLRNFGPSSVDFVLYFWIPDVTQGRGGPRNDVMFSIWRKFRENDIEFPLPPRELNVKLPDVIEFKSRKD
jgi:small-conductance mechanosensitive channel